MPFLECMEKQLGRVAGDHALRTIGEVENDLAAAGAAFEGFNSRFKFIAVIAFVNRVR